MSAAQAVLWLAPGALLRDDYCVPSAPPARLVVAILEPHRTMWCRDEESVATCRIQQAEFALMDDGPASRGRAHYMLTSRAPDGWRWVAMDKTLHAERIADGAR